MTTSVTCNATHHSVVRFGDLTCEAVVLDSGERGYVHRQLVGLLGFTPRQRGARFMVFMQEMSPNALNLLQKKGVTVLLPSGQKAQFFPAGIIAELASAVVNARIADDLEAVA